MLSAFLIAFTVVCAVQAIRSGRLIASALWLAGASALLAIVLYQFGAPQVAVIELSVGAGLVTVLFVFAINVAGEEEPGRDTLLPKPLAWGLVLFSILLLGWMTFPSFSNNTPISNAEPSPATVLWQDRGLDMLVQVALIFSGVLGLLGLLAEAKAPLEGAAAEEVAAQRERELQALQEQTEQTLARQEERS